MTQDIGLKVPGESREVVPKTATQIDIEDQRYRERVLAKATLVEHDEDLIVAGVTYIPVARRYGWCRMVSHGSRGEKPEYTTAQVADLLYEIRRLRNAQTSPA